ncbi:MAG: zinc ribbon domain-containing protein [Chloroflexota bacterium]
MINSSFMRIGTTELAIILGSILALIWLFVGIWAFRDMRRRSRSGWLAVAVFLLVFLLPIAGLIIYLLMRPRETLMEQYDRTLQQEVLLQQIETNLTCPGCSRAVDANWLVCPECHVTLRRPCRHCGTALEMHWQICPVCAHMVDLPEPPVNTMDVPAPEQQNQA